MALRNRDLPQTLIADFDVEARVDFSGTRLARRKTSCNTFNRECSGATVRASAVVIQQERGRATARNDVTLHKVFRDMPVGSTKRKVGGPITALIDLAFLHDTSLSTGRSRLDTTRAGEKEFHAHDVLAIAWANVALVLFDGELNASIGLIFTGLDGIVLGMHPHRAGRKHGGNGKKALKVEHRCEFVFEGRPGRKG